MGLDEAGRIWDELTKTGCFVKKAFDPTPNNINCEKHPLAVKTD